VPAARGDVHLAAEDRFDAAAVGLLVELDAAVHRAVIGERKRGHPGVVRRPHEIGNPIRAVEKAVLGVVVEMNEVAMGQSHGSLTVTSRREEFPHRSVARSSNTPSAPGSAGKRGKAVPSPVSSSNS
jgi:hypothetical protein